MSTQRRSYGFGTPDPTQYTFPRITPPQGLLTGRQVDEKHGRHGLRSLTFTHRLSVLVTVAVFVFLCMKVLSPPVAEQPLYIYSNAKLTPRDYLNGSGDGPPPFSFCPAYGPGDPLVEKYGTHVLSKSKLYTGSGTRIQKVIKRALSGQPVTISVLGGSISACHGAGNDPISPACYPSRFFQWWNEVFPHPASELTNGAVRRTNSAYFSFCHGHHIPDHTDLIILEFDSDDPNDPEWLDHFELLVRSLLVRPDMPSIIILGHFSPQIQIQHGYAGPEFLHTVVAQYYDVPHISIKPILYSNHLTSPDSIKTYYADPILANENGHELLADVLISYFQSQICGAWASATKNRSGVDELPADAEETYVAPIGGKGLFGGVPARDGPGDFKVQGRVGGKGRTPYADAAAFRVPPARLHARPSDMNHFREVRPFCVSANDLINPLPPSLFYGSGWHVYHPPKGASFAEGGETAHYWYSTLPTSTLRVPMKMGSGDVAIYYWREDDSEDLSGVKCWVDDNLAGAIDIWNFDPHAGGSGPSLKVIDHLVTTGSHYVTCELLGEEGRGVPPFKILGIFST